MALVPIDWMIGVLLAVMANILNNLGLNLQKLAHTKRSKKELERIKKLKEEEYNTHIHRRTLSSQLTVTAIEKNSPQGSYCCDPTWISGMANNVVGSLCDFGALGFAPQSVVAPLGSLTLVINVFLSKVMHHERLSNKAVAATIVIMFGAVVTVIFSPKGSELESVKDVLNVYVSINFYFYSGILLFLLTILFFIVEFFLKISESNPKLYKNKYYKTHRFCIAMLSGTIGAQNILFAKGISTLLNLTLSGKGMMFIEPITYGILFGLSMTLWFQLRWLNAALKRFSALHIVPIFQAFWICVSVMGGLIVYEEYKQMSLLAIYVFPVGVLIIISGVSYLTTQGQPENLKKSDEIRKNRISRQLSIRKLKPNETHTRKNNNSFDRLDTLKEEDSNISDMPSNTKLSQHNYSQSAPGMPIRSQSFQQFKSNSNRKPTNIPVLAKSKSTNFLFKSLNVSQFELPKFPTPQEFVAKVYQLSDASVVFGSGLGRLVVRSDVLSDIDFGVTEKDKLFFLKDNNSGVSNETLEELELDLQTDINTRKNTVTISPSSETNNNKKNNSNSDIENNMNGHLNLNSNSSNSKRDEIKPNGLVNTASNTTNTTNNSRNSHVSTNTVIINNNNFNHSDIAQTPRSNNQQNSSSSDDENPDNDPPLGIKHQSSTQL